MRRLPVLFICLLLWPGTVRADVSDAELVSLLRAGGLTVYFRHAATDWSQSDRIVRHGDWKSCDGRKIRQLSEAGRATAREIGAAMRKLGVPVSQVLSTEYCRAVETAEGLDVGPVETTLDIMNLRAADFVGGRDAVIARFRTLLATPPAPGTNRVITAHGNLIQAGTGIYPGEAGAAVFLPDPDAPHGFRAIAELVPADWTRLAAEGGK